MSDSQSKSDRRSLQVLWSDWFYAKEVPYALALVRIFAPLPLLIAFVPRWFHVREMYSTDGSPTPFWEAYGVRDLLPIFPPAVASALFALMIILLLTASLGWKTRPSLCVLVLLVPYFGLVDGMTTMTKYTVLTTHLFAVLALSQCGSLWSIDAWLARKKNPDWKPLPTEIWPQRLIQLLIGFVYLGAAVTKTQTDGFFSGDQMVYWGLTNVNFPNPVGEWLTLYPAVFVITGYITAFWEIVFLFLVWKDPGRKVVIGLGILFHAMTYFVLGLVVFPLLYFAIYACYLKESEAQKVGIWLARWLPVDALEQFVQRSSKAFSAPSFAVVLAAICLTTIPIEAQLDVYQTARGGELPPLTELSPELAAKVMRNDTALDIEDQLFAADIGTMVVGGYIANPKRSFRAGEVITLQTRLVHPHGDVWVEYILLDPQQQVVARNGMLAQRDRDRLTFEIASNSQFPSGEYQLTIQIDGKPVTQKRLNIDNQSMEVAANH